jgi:hypothetical protein
VLSGKLQKDSMRSMSIARCAQSPGVPQPRLISAYGHWPQPISSKGTFYLVGCEQPFLIPTREVGFQLSLYLTTPYYAS